VAAKILVWGFDSSSFSMPAGRSDAESVLPGLESWLENGEGEAAWQLVDSDEVGMR
jgi:hypothetical protein